MISATSEISRGNTKSSFKFVSLLLSVLIFITCLIAWVLIFTLWIRKRKQKIINVEKHSYFDEVYDGIKPKFCACGYTLFSTSRIYILVIVMIFSSNIQSVLSGLENIKIYELVIFQFIYLIWMLILRPMKCVEANLVLATNELIFFVLASTLVYYNTEKRWTETIESIYIRIISSNNMITSFIIFVAFIIKLIKNCRAKCKSKKIEPKKESKPQPHQDQLEIHHIPPSSTNPNEEEKTPNDVSQSSGIDFNSSYHHNYRNTKIPIAVHLKNYKYKSRS